MAKLNTGDFALLAVLILGGALVAGGYLSATGGTMEATGECPDTGVTDIRLSAVSQTDKDQPIAPVNASVFLKGGFTPLDTRVTVSGLNSTATDIECGGDYVVVFGYNMTTYYQTIVDGLNAGDAAVNTVNGKVDLQGDIAVTGDNSTNFGASGLNITMGQGETNTEVVLHIRESVADARFGQGHIMICSTYNATNISSVSFAGAEEVAAPEFLTGTQECYKIAAPELDEIGGKMAVNPIIAAESAVDPNGVGGESVTFRVMDYFHYYYQGADVYGVAMPEDDTAYGATDVEFTVSIN